MNPVQFQMMASPPSDGALERFLNVQFETALCVTPTAASGLHETDTFCQLEADNVHSSY
jgi:hypothetical protein